MAANAIIVDVQFDCFTTFLQRNYVEISKGNEKLLKKKFACFDFLDTF